MGTHPPEDLGASTVVIRVGNEDYGRVPSITHGRRDGSTIDGSGGVVSFQKSTHGIAPGR